MKQKTPLALLQEWIKENPDGDLLAKIQELKEVEKEQMLDMWERGAWNHIWQETRTDYFNENYKQ